VSSGRRFDWVLISRFDVAFFARVPPLPRWAARASGVHYPSNHGIMSDHWALMPRAHADAYTSAVSQLCCFRCAAPTWNEALLRTQLLVQGVPLHAGFVPWVLVRRTNGSIAVDCEMQKVCTHTCRRPSDAHPTTGAALPPCWPPCPEEATTIRRCAHAFEGRLGSYGDVCRKDNGWTGGCGESRRSRKSSPLHSAAYRGDLDGVELQLRGGADVHSTQHRTGMTPLHMAALGGNAAVVRRLLKAGANATALDDHLRPAAVYARRRGHAAAVEVLEKV